jgi:MFS family permease
LKLTPPPPSHLHRYWATDYLITALHYEKQVVMVSFIITSATAPVAGVFFGGFVIDKFGGFKTVRGKKVTMRIVLLFGILANIAAAPATFTPPGALWMVIACLWLLLFFGGACLPALTGLFIDAVPDHLKALGSSISQVRGGGGVPCESRAVGILASANRGIGCFLSWR